LNRSHTPRHWPLSRSRIGKLGRQDLPPPLPPLRPLPSTLLPLRLQALAFAAEARAGAGAAARAVLLPAGALGI